MPEFEVRQVAHWLGILYETFQEMGYMNRVGHIAHYRADHMVDAHVSDAVSEAATRMQGI